MLFHNLAQNEGIKLQFAESTFLTFLENKDSYVSPGKLILPDTLEITKVVWLPRF